MYLVGTWENMCTYRVLGRICVSSGWLGEYVYLVGAWENMCT